MTAGIITDQVPSSFLLITSSLSQSALFTSPFRYTSLICSGLATVLPPNVAGSKVNLRALYKGLASLTLSRIVVSATLMIIPFSLATLPLLLVTTTLYTPLVSTSSSPKPASLPAAFTVPSLTSVLFFSRALLTTNLPKPFSSLRPKFSQPVIKNTRLNINKRLITLFNWNPPFEIFTSGFWQIQYLTGMEENP